VALVARFFLLPMKTSYTANSFAKVGPRTASLCADGSILSEATRIQSQLFSVGFVASGLSPRHAGFRPILRVPRRPWLAGNLAVSTALRFLLALCSQRTVENRVDLAHAESI
jgi:hypothetical protein